MAEQDNAKRPDLPAHWRARPRDLGHDLGAAGYDISQHWDDAQASLRAAWISSQQARERIVRDGSSH